MNYDIIIFIIFIAVISLFFSRWLCTVQRAAL